MSDVPEHNNDQIIKSDEIQSSIETCYNCKQPLDPLQKFCPNCGQKRGNKRASFWTLVKDFLGDFFNWDSKFFRSIIPLAIKPGYLTNEYIIGRRIRYIPPIRLYIFLSFIYFLIVSITGSETNLFETNKSGNDPIATFTKSEGDSTEIIGLLDLDKIEEWSNPDSLQFDKDALYHEFRNPPDTVTHTASDRLFAALWMVVRGVDSQELIDSIGVSNVLHQQIIFQSGKLIDNPKSYIQSTIKNISILLFFLMPVFALILKLLYLRRKFYYSEHIIFSFHYHAYIFLILLFVLILNQVTWAVGLLIVYIWVYLYFALKKVYQQGYLKTFIKYIMLQSLYLLALIIGVSITFAITFYLL